MSDIAVDSSSLIALLYGQWGQDTAFLQQHIQQQSAFLPPPVVSEVLSYSGITRDIIERVQSLPLLPIEEGYWQRTGEIRRIVLSNGRKAYLPDALIAQSCIDHKIPLLTRDPDFENFSKYCGLSLAISSSH